MQEYLSEDYTSDIELDLEKVNKRILSLRSEVYQHSRNLREFGAGEIDIPLEKIIEEKVMVLRKYQQSADFLSLKKEYEELLKIKKSLEYTKSNKAKEILEILKHNQDIRILSLKWLLSTRTYNALFRKEIYTLWDIIDYIVENLPKLSVTFSADYYEKHKISGKRQDLLISTSHQIWKGWIEEIEELLKKYNIHI